jgi:2-methylcitrate dehydratase PrpD
MATDSPTRALGQFVSDLRYDDIPDDIRHEARRALLDTIGCGVFGATLPWCKAAMAGAAIWSGAGDVPVWGTDRRVAPDTAALINGTQVHSFELDDLHKEAILHPGGVTIPALLAVVQTVDRTITGKEFLAAVVAGYEVSIRVGLATGLGLLHRGWHNNGVLGTFGAAAGVARLFGLSADGATDAIGMAASQSAGLMSAQYSSMIKRIHAGKAAQSGLYAAVFAQQGIRGIRDVFETGYGGFAATFTDEYHLADLTAGLNQEWRTGGIGFKPYPACGSSHTGIDAALSMVKDDGVRASDITAIRIASSTATEKHVGWAYVPDTVTTAQMNLPFAVASAFVRGSVTPDAFGDDALRDPAVLDIAGKIEVTADPEIDSRGRAFRHEIRMTVELADGRTLTRHVEHATGSDRFPLTDGDLVAKFDSLADAVLPSDRVAALRQAVWTIEEATDMRELNELLAVSG